MGLFQAVSGCFRVFRGVSSCFSSLLRDSAAQDRVSHAQAPDSHSPRRLAHSIFHLEKPGLRPGARRPPELVWVPHFPTSSTLPPTSTVQCPPFWSPPVTLPPPRLRLWGLPAPGSGVWAAGPVFEGKPEGEGTTRRGTATPVHRLQRPAGSTHSSTRGLRPPQHGTLIPSAQRLVWAAKQPLGNAALGALFACFC